MKTVVVTIAAGELYTDIAKLTHPTIKAYADKIGADFLVWTDNGTHRIPHYRKLDIGGLLNDYDRVLYVDTDIIIRPDSPNIFDLVPYNEIGMFEEGRYAERAKNMIRYLTGYGVDPASWNGKYYNTGVIVVSKCHKLMFMQPSEEGDNFYEQTYLNMMVTLLKGKVCDLHYKFNRMYLMDKFTGEQRFDSYFMHYAGLNAAMPKDLFLERIKQDLAVWENSAPDYNFKKNIAIWVEGGLGDQVCAEPVIRYVRDVIYKGDNIVVLTDFPDAFDHLGLPVFKKTDRINDMGFFELHTAKGPEDASWQYMSQGYTNGVDFSSLQVFKGTLPPAAKRIQQHYDLTDLVPVLELVGENIQDVVLVHPGRGWASKTFPAEFWDSVIDALIKDGRKVVVIGKRISAEQGVVEVTDRPDCINLIDKLTYKQLVALISQAKVLITNDSSPVHIAGAFDNYIGAIATCKRPEHIFPYRYGDVFYRAKDLSEGRMYDKFNWEPASGQVNGATMDYIPGKNAKGEYEFFVTGLPPQSPGNIWDFLPKPEKVVNYVRECFNDQGIDTKHEKCDSCVCPDKSGDCLQA